MPWHRETWVRDSRVKDTKAHRCMLHFQSPEPAQGHTHSVTSRMEQMWKLVKCCLSLWGADLHPALSAWLPSVPVGSAHASRACLDFFRWWWGPQQSWDCRECVLLDLKDCGKSLSHLAGEKSWLCLCQLWRPNISRLIAVSIGKTRRRFSDSEGSWEGLPSDTDHSWQGAAWGEAAACGSSWPTPDRALRVAMKES